MHWTKTGNAVKEQQEENILVFAMVLEPTRNCTCALSNVKDLSIVDFQKSSMLKEDCLIVL
jgi:hypothetical protein